VRLPRPASPSACSACPLLGRRAFLLVLNRASDVCYISKDARTRAGVISLGDPTIRHITIPARVSSCRTTRCCWTRHHVSGFVLRMIFTAALSPIFS
jgi:hypothetical protein